jgi:hypothetical protein
VKQPTVTVLLPSHNAAAWLRDAVDSVLRQSFRDFELLIIDDGSTDHTDRLLSAYSDHRIRVFRHARNQGLIASLNRGIGLAKGRFLARMDADDVAHRRRLGLQVAFMDANPEVGICGTWFRLRRGWRRFTVRTPRNHHEIAARLFFRSAFGHPTVMLRREFLEKTGLRYDPQALHAEDYDLWVRARGLTRLANLAQALLDYRVHGEQISLQHLQPQSESVARIRLQQLALMLPGASAEEKRLHLRVCEPQLSSSSADLSAARSWLDLLEETNRRDGMFHPAAFADALANSWFHCCLRTSLGPHEVLPIYLSRRYTGLGTERLREHVLLTYKALLRPTAAA